MHSSHGIVKAFAENKESVKKYDVELLHRKLNFKISAFQIKKKNALTVRKCNRQVRAAHATAVLRVNLVLVTWTHITGSWTVK